MEPLVPAKLAQFKFHGIPWNCSCHRNWRTPSSMEFHGTAPVIEIGALQVPWNSMKFHGTAHVNEIGTLEVQWNSMELLVSSKLAHSKFHGIPWNSMEPLVPAKLAQFKFHGIPWNCSCHRNWRTPSSMEFHGTAPVIEIGALEVPWNSMEFHGTARVIEIGALQIPWNSMELLLSVPWNSMEPIVCYLMEPLVSSIHWVLKWDRIPCNLSFQILIKIIFNCAGWINFRKSINTLYLFASLFHQLMFYYLHYIWYLHYTICISAITHYVSKYHSKSIFNAHWNLFWSKSSMELSPEFHGIFWTTFEQHLWFHGIPWNLSNKTSSSMEFHGILSRSKVLWNSMELFPYSRVPWNSMEFRGTFNFPKKSSMEFHGTW